MTRTLIRAAYLGDGFHGSQAQPDSRTVEGEILRCMGIICGLDREGCELKFSSRTDRGVNSLGNPFTVRTPFKDSARLVKALNALSEGVYFTSFADVGDDFNPRHADRRRYRYILPSEGLDIDSARSCARLFEGEHDFIRFCRPEDKSTVLTVDSIAVTPGDGVLALDFTARYFLWNMVRRISAAIAGVASDRFSEDDVLAALGGREVNFGVARPDALTLRSVEYDSVSFTEADPSWYRERLEDDLFRCRLRSSFLKSL